MAKDQDLLNPESTPNKVKQGKELSKLAPILIGLVFALIVLFIFLAIARRGPTMRGGSEEVEIVAVKSAPIGEDSVGEIEPEKKKAAVPRKEEIKEIEELKKEIKLISKKDPPKAPEKNKYWEKYMEMQLADGQAKRERLLAAAQAASTIGGAESEELSQKNEASPSSGDALVNALTSRLNAAGPGAGPVPGGYDVTGYQQTAQEMLKNQLATLPGAGGNDQNMQRSKNKFFDENFSSKGDTNYLEYHKVAQQSKYELKEGSLIDGIMISGINSDLPGKIIAQVSKNIYDSTTGKILLIPQGTKLIGRYSSVVAYAQDRVALGWTRMIFPNGDSLNLGNMGGVDQEGYSGLKDKVNNHYVRLFGQVALISFFQAVPALVNPSKSSSKQTTTIVTETEEVIAGMDEDGKPIIVTLKKTKPVTTTSSSSTGSNSDFESKYKESYGQTVAQVGVDLAKRNMSIQPTIKVRQGKKFKIIVTKDMLLPPKAVK